MADLARSTTTLAGQPISSALASWRAAARNWDSPPLLLWLLPVAIAVLRMIPFLWTLAITPPDGQTVLQASYMPPDVLSYQAFIRQASETSSILLANPYTLDPQHGRYILLLHSGLGFLSAASGVSATWLWELSRLPLSCLFLLTLWWFLKPILPARNDRIWACVLVGLSGGVEGIMKLVADRLPAFFSNHFAQATWHLYGWNTFEVLANPMWIAGLTLLLVVLKPLLQPDGLRNVLDQVQVGMGFLLLFYVHPYSALVVLTVAGALAVADWIFTRRLQLDKQLPILRALCLPFVVIAIISTWQSQDVVYRQTAGNVFGTLQLSVFWYPFTLGFVGVLALRGAQRWTQTQHPYRFSLLAWIAAVIFMHTSPVLNGYHFVMYLHLPLCILAAPVLRQQLQEVRGSATPGTRIWKRMVAYGTLLLTFVSFALVTIEATADIRRNNLRPAEYEQIISELQALPAGRLLADHELGSIVPTYTSHQVYVGHWFLSPDFLAKRERYAKLTSDAQYAPELARLVAEQQIDYLLVPRQQANWVAERFADRYSKRITFHSQTLFALHASSAPRQRLVSASSAPRQQLGTD
ncbi:MAG: hypothetical protein CL681_10660 [Blastopirellula sp.]|nr:hypothetical protein [Blastopirellula sp.]MAR10421.1 hypothetical protein [Blastopirellula sp.]